MLQYSLNFIFSVKQTFEIKNGKRTAFLNPISTEITMAKDYNLDLDDPWIYQSESWDKDFHVDRKWPKLKLPVPPEQVKRRAATQVAGVPTASTLGKAPDLDPKTKEDLVDHFLHLHKVACQELESLGVDACDRYKADKAIFVLQAVTKNSKKCQLCDQTINSTQRLREHITKKHLPPRYQHFCDHPDCEVVCGSEGELNEHKKIHVAKPTNPQHPNYCAPCKKGFPSKSKYNEHIDNVHGDWDRKCPWCPEDEAVDFSYKKNKKKHMTTCIYKPGGAPKFLCFFCDRDFSTKENRNAHCRNLHKGRKFNPKEDNLSVPTEGEPDE